MKIINMTTLNIKKNDQDIINEVYSYDIQKSEKE